MLLLPDDDEPPTQLPGDWSACTRCGVPTQVRGHYMGPGNLRTWCCCDDCDRGIRLRTKSIWQVDTDNLMGDT